MAEQVNQRIQEMVNELEQMRRTDMFNDDEIREMSRKRKEFEYRIQRRVKQKEDFVQYITYEMALLEEITKRRQLARLREKRNDIEFAIANRLNKLFKQFIYRFQNEVEIYFEYMKFCKSVGFDHSISAIIGQMLQIHGDKPKTWQLASKWERQEQKTFATAKQFLLKGIHRHPTSSVLYLELLEIELTLILKAETDEEKAKQAKVAEVVWREGVKVISDVSFLFKLCDLCLKFDVDQTITDSIKAEVWSKKDQKEVWAYIAGKELEGYHWKEIEEYVYADSQYSSEIQYFMGAYEEALEQFPDSKLCIKYIHQLLGVSDTICSEHQKISAVKRAWMFGHGHGLLSNDMYEFGIAFLKLQDIPEDELMEIIDAAIKSSPQVRCIWEEKLMMNKTDEKKMLSVLQEASKVIAPSDALHLWNLTLDNITSNDVLKGLHKRFQACESTIVLAIKPKLLQKVYDNNGLKAARELYEELIKTPPTQADVHKVMINVEKSQEKLNVKNIRKYYECAVQHHGKENLELWTNYMQFETESGNIQFAPTIYRRAVATLTKELSDDFIKAQTLAKLN